MEEDRQRPYSFLTRDEVQEKMKKQIDEISEIFWVSRSDATVLLMYFRWDSLRVSDRLGEDKENLLTESGLKSVVVIDSDGDSSFVIFSKTGDDFYEFEDGSGDDDDVGVEGNDSNPDSSCGICMKTFDDFISTPFCSHKFCTTCWREYLDKNFYSLEKNQTTVISCPDQDCRAAFGHDTVEKLTVRDKEMFESYVLRSYLEGIKKEMIKQCPSPDCNYIIKFHQASDAEAYGLNVVCLCSHTFCWRCKLESHRPVTCSNASDWLSKDLSALEESDEHDDYWVSCVDKWKAAQISMEEAKSDLDDFDGYIIKKPDSMKEKDVSIVRVGLMLIIQCRQVLKWSCVYEHLHTDCEMSKKEYLRFLQENATDLLNSYIKTLLDETEGAFLVDTVEELCKFRHTLTTGTSSIGNYFYHFIKTLQDGLVDVKVKSYDNFGGPKWFCDRCTYGNTWLHKECQKCRDATASPVQALSDLSLN